MTNKIMGVKTGSVPGEQAGVVLIVALVMLMTLTLIGVASMRSSTLEMKIAGNMQQHDTAFQAALSRLEFSSSLDSSNPINFLIAIPDLDNPDSWPVQTCDEGDGCKNGENWSATASATYLSCSKNIGTTLESGKGFSTRIFEVTAVGETLSGSSNSVQVSAISYPVKGCGTEI